MHKLIDAEIKKITQDYKISKDQALLQLLENLSKNKDLKVLLESEPDESKVERTRLYKDFIKNTRKEIYYSLRKYATNENAFDERLEDKDFDWFVQNHISTKERLPYIKSFNDQIIAALAGAKTVVDLGGGLDPLTFPFESLPNLTHFTWVDKDAKSFAVLTAYKADVVKKFPDVKIDLLNQNLETFLASNQKQWDAAVMFKLIPIIYRQDRHIFKKLAEFSAKKLLVTASKQAMVKNQSIFSREKKTLDMFADISKRKTIGTIDIETEFGIILA